ncbi:hypothetical protein SETIT_1G085100v2 [Setaria italica]|uniref:Leucine-rich repeat-containing N-terminal plant-type domain-containing protein n=1 Tax=Setaria italica TaxID=4555 RepID=A0A368PI44_SETIT|nr:hypothetical protein SETIT_1G085100v2 [Setaria italica]
MQPLQFPYKNYSSRLPIPSLGFAALLLISLATLTSSCTEQEKNSLLQFVSGLSQDAGLAKLWQVDTDCCNWEGITCNGNKTVIDVSLASRGLEGHISQSLGNLTGLQQVNLSYNLLSGGLALELVSSSSIIVLDVSFNQLNGDLHEFPSSIPGRPLQVLNISSNLFTGQFTSTTWKGMQNLIALNASNNSFTGHIPSHFCNISPSFSVLELSYNKLSGSIPPGLGNCSKLRVLKAGHNYLSGTLPEELFKATLLEHLSFSSNGLQGILDSTHIVKLGKMAILDLGENKFSGMIPDSIGQLTRLQELHLEYSSMSGELPSTLSNCTDLITLDLKCNNFSGELNKVGFSNFPNLKTLDLMWNNFSGTIPESIYSCRNLIALRLSSNKFHGQLSKGLSNLKSLSFLSLTNNKKTAAHLDPRVFYLPVYSGPSLQRRIPIAFPKALYLSGNKFTGVIPPEIGHLKALISLDISFNNLTGPIPSSICNLTNLEVLDLSNNNLTGEIPAVLENLYFLAVFNVSNNNLQGPIPTGRQFNTFPNSSFAGNPRMCGPGLNHHCTSVEVGLAPTGSRGLCGGDIVFAVSFSVFIGVGVLYDQMVLSRYFG